MGSVICPTRAQVSLRRQQEDLECIGCIVDDLGGNLNHLFDRSERRLILLFLNDRLA
jgi:hypothetical protein